MIKPNKLIQTCFETRFYYSDAVDFMQSSFLVLSRNDTLYIY